MSSFGLVGKLPCRDDFVRHHLTGAAQAFDLWMQRAVDGTLEAGVSMEGVQVRFFMGWADAQEAVVGLLAPSRDGVGRHYPLALFQRVPLSSMGGDFAALPVAAHAFLEGASQLVDDAQALPFDATCGRLAGLPPITAASFAEARAICERTLRAERAAEFEARVFVSAEVERAYAYDTLLTAATPLAGHYPERPGPTLACPIAVDVDQFAWLELTRRALEWPAIPPTALWCEEPSPRMLVSLGDGPPKALSCLLDPAHASRLVWPLRTDSEEARAEATDRLQASLAALGPGAGLGELIDAVARARQAYVR